MSITSGPPSRSVSNSTSNINCRGENVTQYPPPNQSPNAPQPTPKKAASVWYRRTWVIAVAAAIIGVGVGAASGATQSKTKTVAKPGPTVTATATTTETATATVTATPTVIKTVATRVRTRTVTYTPAPPPSFSDGTYQAGVDIDPGRYRDDGSADCYYQVSSDASGNNIIANDDSSGPMYAEVQSGQYLQVSGGCQWRRVA
jgi:hypothetical protein